MIRIKKSLPRVWWNVSMIGRSGSVFLYSVLRGAINEGVFFFFFFSFVFSSSRSCGFRIWVFPSFLYTSFLHAEMCLLSVLYVTTMI